MAATSRIKYLIDRERSKKQKMNYDLEIKTTNGVEILRYNSATERDNNWKNILALIENPSPQFLCGGNTLINKDYIISIKKT